jgi:hypothetical protein
MTILTPHEIAKLFHSSERWVYKHAADLGGFRVGGKIFFRKEDVEDAITRGKGVEDCHQNRRAKKIIIYKSLNR